MSFDRWSKVNLVDCLDKLIDYRGKTPAKSEKGILTLSAKSVKNSNIDYSEAYTISEEEYKKFMVRGIPVKGDILITTEAPMGQVAKLDRNGIAIAQRLLTLRPNPKILNNDYLLYYLQSPIGQAELKARESGSTVTGIKQAEFRKINIILPPLNEQKAIANILSSLDDKIELNNKINKILEELAQTLYKRWFVDFEFPNEDGKPYKSSGGEMVESELGLIPKAWIVKSVNQIVDIINGYSYKGLELANSDIAMATIKNFSRNGGFQIDGFKELIPSKNIKDNLKLNELDMIIACTDLTQNAEIIGNIALLMTKDKYNEIIISMDLVKLVPIDQINKLFIYESLKDKKFKDYAVSCTSGTTVLHLNKNAAFNYKISIPSESKIIIYFNDIVSKIYEKITNNLKTTDKLIKLRNELLPKLMNGEIEVPIEE